MRIGISLALTTKQSRLVLLLLHVDRSDITVDRADLTVDSAEA